MPFADTAEKRREITAGESGALLSGIDLSQAKRRKRYQSVGMAYILAIAMAGWFFGSDSPRACS